MINNARGHVNHGRHGSFEAAPDNDGKLQGPLSKCRSGMVDNSIVCSRVMFGGTRGCFWKNPVLGFPNQEAEGLVPRFCSNNAAAHKPTTFNETH